MALERTTGVRLNTPPLFVFFTYNTIKYLHYVSDIITKPENKKLKSVPLTICGKKMSYAPGTKLSHSNEAQCATVLTKGNVIVTKGFAYEQMMPLEDWLILAEKNAIKAVFTDAERQRRAEESLAHAGRMWSKAYAEHDAKADSQKRAEADLAHAGAMWSKARDKSSSSAVWAALGAMNNDIVESDDAPSPLRSANDRLEAKRDEAAKASMWPLTGTTDAEKLYELECRFKGAEFVLSMDTKQVLVSTIVQDGNRYIVLNEDDYGTGYYASFATILGASKRPSLMAEYLGLYIDLSHLF